MWNWGHVLDDLISFLFISLPYLRGWIRNWRKPQFQPRWRQCYIGSTASYFTGRFTLFIIEVFRCTMAKISNLRIIDGLCGFTIQMASHFIYLKKQHHNGIFHDFSTLKWCWSFNPSHSRRQGPLITVNAMLLMVSRHKGPGHHVARVFK